MKKFFTTALFLCISMMSQFAFAALPHTVRFATEATYPPFAFSNEKGEIQGFDIDVVHVLCKEIKVECTFTSQAWDSLIPSLQLGKFDALAGGMTITEERKKQVDFTEPYYANSLSFVGVTKKKFDVSGNGLKGKIVGVQSGTTSQQYLQQQHPDVQVKAYTSQQDAFLDLISGRVDVVLADTPVITHWLYANDPTRDYMILGQPITDPKYAGLGYGIAVKKGNTELLSALNKAIEKMKASGEDKKIIKKYFS